MKSRKIAPTVRATNSAMGPAAAGSLELAEAPSGRLAVRPLPAGSDIRKVGAEEVAAVAESLARAFYDDPMMRWLFPVDARRLERLRDGFEFYLARIWLRHDACYTTDRRIGAACWLPPGTWRLSLPRQLALLPAMVRRFGRDLPRLMRFFAAIEKVHPHEPHMYLPAVGVAPEWQGRGFGAALLRPVLERCDRERLPAYLEATSPRNRALYERHGFETVEELRVAKDAPLVWRMWRAARAGDESDTGTHDSGG